MRRIEFVPEAFREYQTWVEEDKKIALRIGDLIKDILRTPFEGIGKPEPLKHQFKGYWSRRISHEHRLIYKVNEESLLIIHAIHIINKTGVYLKTFKNNCQCYMLLYTALPGMTSPKNFSDFLQ